MIEKVFKALMGKRMELVKEVQRVFKKEGYEFFGYRPRK